jgi:hypothetical protein
MLPCARRRDVATMHPSVKVPATPKVRLAAPARAGARRTPRRHRAATFWYARGAMDLQLGRARIGAWRASISQKNG